MVHIGDPPNPENPYSYEQTKTGLNGRFYRFRSLTYFTSSRAHNPTNTTLLLMLTTEKQIDKRLNLGYDLSLRILLF